jgi:hypothetical protein
MYRCGVGSGPLKDFQGRESTSLSGARCNHHQEYIKTADAITGTKHVSMRCNGPEPTPHRYMILYL